MGVSVPEWTDMMWRGNQLGETQVTSGPMLGSMDGASRFPEVGIGRDPTTPTYPIVGFATKFKSIIIINFLI